MATIPIESLGAHLTGQLEDAVKTVKKDIFRELVESTPVDRGQLRGGWVPSDGTPTGDSPNRIDKSGDAVLAEVDQLIDGSDAASITYLSNNEHYAAVVNARNGMTQAAADYAPAAVRKVADK